ncbi:MAG: TRAP transporter substrate-binding protein, partial [Geminicoccales bacterium]
RDRGLDRPRAVGDTVSLRKEQITRWGRAGGCGARPAREGRKIMRNGRVLAAALGVALAAALASTAAAQDTFKYKMGHYVPPSHFFSQYLEKWVETLRERSDGRLDIQIFDGSQMGPTPRYYDLARTGVADITWFLHGATPGRFPLTELINLPYLVGSAEIGTKVLNEPALRKYLDEEHRGIKVLYLLTHQPGNLHTRERLVRTVEEMRGLRIRFAAATIREYVAALGGTPVGVPPPEIAEALQKGTIDGVFIDYGGAHTAFKLGGLVKYTTELYAYVTSFGVAMNPKSYDRLPPDLQQLINETTTGIAEEVGKMWDAADAPGKKYLQSEGSESIVLAPEEKAKFLKIGAEVTEKVVAELEAKGLPAREVYGLMRELSEKHAKTSHSFLD